MGALVKLLCRCYKGLWGLQNKGSIRIVGVACTCLYGSYNGYKRSSGHKAVKKTLKEGCVFWL